MIEKNMFKKLFRKNDVIETLISPLTGKVIKIEDVPDEMFSKKMLGDGIAIEATDGTVVAPIGGEIVQLFPTKHAIGIRGTNGLEVLIHIGLETVALNGEGFESFVKQGDKIRSGDKLVSFDLNFIKAKAASIITPIVITNPDMVDSLTKSEETFVTCGKSKLLTVKIK